IDGHADTVAHEARFDAIPRDCRTIRGSSRSRGPRIPPRDWSHPTGALVLHGERDEGQEESNDSDCHHSRLLAPRPSSRAGGAGASPSMRVSEACLQLSRLAGIGASGSTKWARAPTRCMSHSALTISYSRVLPP